MLSPCDSYVLQLLSQLEGTTAPSFLDREILLYGKLSPSSLRPSRADGVQDRRVLGSSMALV